MRIDLDAAPRRALSGGVEYTHHMLASVVLSLAVTAAPGKPRIAVLELAAAGEVDPQVARVITESVVAEVAVRGYFEPISQGEIATLIGVERQKQLLGCGDEACLTEVASALGAPYVLSGSVARLEGIFQLNLQVVDTVKARALARSTKVARDFEALRALIPYAVAEASGTPLPPPPSKALPITLLGVGAASFIAGGVLGLLGLTTEAGILGELRTDDDNRAVVLSSAESYRQRLGQTAMLKTAALSTLLAGAALVALGIVLMPGDAPQPGVKVSLVPSGSGLAVVGVWP